MTIQVTKRENEYRDLSSLTTPRSVAIVGANDRRDAFTGGTVINLGRHGFTGAVYPVNPRRDVVNGLRCYPDLGSLPEPIEQVVVAVRADAVVDTLRSAATAGASSAIVVSSGFGEGAADAGAQERLLALQHCLDETGLTVLGPSTTGLVNLNDQYVPRAVINHLDPEHLQPGPIALISQSGAANNVVFNRAHSHGVRVGLAIATGLQTCIDLWDAAAHAIADPRITTLAMLVEDLGGPERYEPVLRAAYEAGKPVVLLRTGRSDVGSAAIVTHTASLAGDWAVEREVLMDLGVTLVSDLEQLWQVADLLQRWGRPTHADVRLGVIAFSGGEGALIADQTAEAGLQMPGISESFRDLVVDQMELAGAGNPFDPTGEAIGSPDAAARVMRGFVEMNDFDACLLAINAQPAPAAGGLLDSALGDFTRATRRAAVSYWDVPGLSDGLAEHLHSLGVPAFDGSHRAVGAIAAWATTRVPYFAGDCSVHSSRTNLRADPRGPTTYWSAREALAGIGIPFADARLVDSASEAQAAALQLGYPLVLKANVESTVHKAAQGLVVVGVRDEIELATHMERLLSTATEVVVEQAVLHSTALVLGASHDSVIGPVIVVGSGGGSVEHLRDTAVIPVLTLTEGSAAAGLRRSRIGRFLAERHPKEFAQTTELILTLASCLKGRPLSIDINPLAVTGDGVIALDARIQELQGDNHG
ncbi:MAG: acetate--CoA ligase family protein [Nocardioidaceae bacterium]|nr:acetate--CoA ligase family protein [Nocardioidaceae bacterium]